MEAGYRKYTIKCIQFISFIFIGWGIALRLIQFFSGRSLWADEAKISLNILNRSYAELTQVLDYNQVAPIGFLWIEKLATQLLGSNEFALRLFPLISGIISLFLIYYLAKHYLHPIAIPISVAFFACNRELIYYSSEIKQYSSDVGIGLLVLAILHSASNRLKTSQVYLFSIVGAIVVWFSHPSVFVLVGVFLSITIPQVIRHIKDKESLHLLGWLVVCSVWIISFGSFYILAIQTASSNEELLTSWLSYRAFPKSFLDLDWLIYSLKRFFWNPLDFPKPFFDKVAIAAFIIGCAALYQRSKQNLFILLLPTAITIGATYLHKYPFYNRIILFLTPFFFLIMAAGLAFLLDLKSKRQSIRAVSMITGWVCVSLLFYVYTLHIPQYLNPPDSREEIKPLLQYIAEKWQPKDVIYVLEKSKYQFEFYRDRFGFQANEYVIGIDLDPYNLEDVSRDRGMLQADLQKDLHQFCDRQRIWILIADTHIRQQTGYMLTLLNQFGQPVEQFKTDNEASFVQLFDTLRTTSGGDSLDKTEPCQLEPY